MNCDISKKLLTMTSLVAARKKNGLTVTIVPSLTNRIIAFSSPYLYFRIKTFGPLCSSIFYEYYFVDANDVNSNYEIKLGCLAAARDLIESRVNPTVGYPAQSEK